MRTLTNNELHRLRHIVAEQMNDAQLEGGEVYLRMIRVDAQDVADALEELVALRTQEEDAAQREADKRTNTQDRFDVIDRDIEDLQEALDEQVNRLSRSFELLRTAVEG